MEQEYQDITRPREVREEVKNSGKSYVFLSIIPPPCNIQISKNVV